MTTLHSSRMVTAACAVLLLIGTAVGVLLFSSKPESPKPTNAAESIRIISLSPAIAVTLRDLGKDNLIVGRDAYDLVLPKSIPVCGDIFKGLDYESILNCHPTHILLQLGSSAMPDRLTDLAAKHHWTVINYPQLTLDDIRSMTRDLEQRFNSDATPHLADHMSASWSRRGNGFPSAGRILLLAALDPPSALGPGSFHHQILERIGGTPAITEGNPYITLDAETVLRLKPDGIILILPRAFDAPTGTPPTTADLRTSLGRIGGLDITAIASGHIALIDHPLAHTPSSAMITIADEMADILARWGGEPR